MKEITMKTNKVSKYLTICALALVLGCKPAPQPSDGSHGYEQKKAETPAATEQKKDDRKTLSGNLANIFYDKSISPNTFSFVLENGLSHNIVSCKVKTDEGEKEILALLALKEYFLEKKKSHSNSVQNVEIRGVDDKGNFICDYIKVEDYFIKFR
jgi:hypothetical protein